MQKAKARETTTTKPVKKSKALLITIWSVFSLFILWIVTTAGVALVRGDGINTFQGKEKEAAIAKLDFIKNEDTGYRGDYWHVDDVYPTTNAEKDKYCDVKQEPAQTGITSGMHEGRYFEYMGPAHEFTSTNPDKLYHFTIKISARPFLGYGEEIFIFDGCAELTRTGLRGGLRPGTGGTVE